MDVVIIVQGQPDLLEMVGALDAPSGLTCRSDRRQQERRQAADDAHGHEEFEDGHMGVNYRFERSLSWLAPRLER